MIPFLFVAAQLFAATPSPSPRHQSAYTSLSLRELVERAAERNRVLPRELASYRARVESEIAVLLRRADGEEAAVSIEQAQNHVQWQRSGEFTQHVTGYRSRAAGPALSSFAFLRKPWAIPTLYGNQLTLFFGQDSSLGPLREDSGDEVAVPARPRGTLAVHPFSARRDEVYDFSGGDTVAVLQTRERAITIVRVVVEPKPEQTEFPVVVFRGEINLDAELSEIVRMRGQFITLGRRGPKRERLLVLPMSVAAYVDLESVLIGGRYWLPRYQRIERHVNVSGLAEGRTVFRIVSRFGEHRITQSSAGDVNLSNDAFQASLDTMGIATPEIKPVRRLTVATGDSLRHARDWALPLGEATAQLRGDDFADVSGDSLTGSPSIAWRGQRLADVLHFNRVEGWSTGAAIEANAGNWAPRLRLRANAGWAWTEETMRGRVELLQSGERGNWTIGTRLGRTLDITNDFTAPHDSGGSLLAALFGVDQYDYVERKTATLWVNIALVPRVATLRIESGLGEDRAASARLTRGLLPAEEPFGPNRGVDPGTYARTALVAEWNPGVVGSALAPGMGALLRYEAATGQLSWRRSTLRIIAREDVGDFGVGALIDAGALTNTTPPPQQLLELGGEPSFPGFAYKEFAGDRALATHWRAMYRLRMLRSPLRILGCTCLTAPAPDVAVTLHGARLWAAGAGTMASIARLGSVGDRVGEEPATPGEGIPISRPTDGWRSSLEVGVRLFGGAVTVGTVRVLEARSPWRASVTIGQQW
jgi:hypothetical protein